MPGRLVIMGLINAGGTPVRVARVILLAAAVLVSVTAWGATSAWANTPLQWSSPAAVDSGSFANRISCPTASLCVAGDDVGDVMTSTNPAGGSNAWSVFPIAGTPSLVDTSCLPGDGFCLVIDDNGTIWGSSTPTSVDTWSSNTEFSSTALAGVSCVHGTNASFGAVDQCEVAAGSNMLWSVDPADSSDASWNAEGADSTANSLTDDSCPTISLCVATDAEGNIIYATNPEGRIWTRNNVAGTTDSLVALSCPSTTFCAAVDADGNVWTTTTPTGTASAWTKTNIDDHALTGISCPSATLCVAIDKAGNAMTSTNPTGGASAWTLQSVDPASSGLAGVSCSSNQQCVIVDNTVVNSVDFADVIVGKVIPLVVSQTPTKITQTGSQLNGTVNPQGVAVSTCQFQYGTTTKYGQTANCAQTVGAGTSAVAVSAAATGLTANTTYHYRLRAANANGAGATPDGTFQTLPNPPTVVTGTATSATQTGVTLNATVNPNSGNVTTCQFQYGTTTTYGKTAACAQTVGAGTTAVSVSAAITGLTANTTYHYRIIATNAGGTGTGADGTLATPPVVTPATPPVTNVTPPVVNPGGKPPQPAVSTLTIGESDFTAQFSGMVNPNGLAAQAHYEFGLDSEYYGGGPLTYDQSTPLQNLPAGSTSQTFAASVTGLVPHALYHVRLVVTSSAGTVTSADQTFMTALAPAPPPPTLGKTANLTPTSGTVLVKLPGGKSPYSLTRSAVTPVPSKGLGFIPVTQARQVPIGTEIDSLRGTLNLVVANGKPHHTQTAHLKGAIYTVSQTRTGRHKGLTTFTLKENAFPGAPSYSSCTSKQTNATAAALPFSKKPKLSSSILQTLRATDNHGQFSTRGRYSAATVRGTDWGVEDRCNGTLTLVHRGTVNVLDFATRKTIAVHAGHSFLAAAVAARHH
jgi:hypothetical protein